MKPILLTLAISVAISISGAANGQGEDAIRVADGQSDYRYVATSKIEAEVACDGIEPKYVLKFAKEAPLQIVPGASVMLFLKNAYFSKPSGLWGNRSDIGVLLNTATNAAFTKSNKSDYGKLIYFQEGLKDRSWVNSSFVPVASIQTSGDAPFVTFDVSVVRFDSETTVMEKSLLRELTQIGTSFSGPIVGQLLSSLGNVIGATQAAGKRMANFRIGLILGHENNLIRQPLLREGDFVLITDKKQDAHSKWSEIYYDHKNGMLYSNNDCTVAHQGFDYLVFTLRQDLGADVESLPSTTLQDLIDKVERRGSGQSEVATEIAEVGANAFGYREAKRAIDRISRALPGVDRDASIKDALLFASCGETSKKDDDCKDRSITLQPARREIERRMVARGLLCPSDVGNLRLSAGSVDALVAKANQLIAKTATCS